MKSWLTNESNNGFGLENIPFGIGISKGQTFACTRIGKYIINLKEIENHGYFKSLAIPNTVFDSHDLNSFLKLKREVHRNIRIRIQELFEEKNNELKNNESDSKQCVLPLESVEMKLPVCIGDYTDFYASIDHATNVGKMFRGPKDALLPNWRHLPVGYHGRSSSIVVSGQPVYRPKGQMMPADATTPVFGQSKLLDFELEMGFVTRQGKELGYPIAVQQAKNYIFGMTLFNDWSARDIQKWEYVPLGPFLGKNFGSSISPWIITLDALEPFRIKTNKQSPEPLHYLRWDRDHGYDIGLEVEIIPKNGGGTIVSKSNFKHMYWSIFQMLAHHSINGCPIKAGDIMASGTISGPTRESFGSMLEISWNGENPVKMKDGTFRSFIEDYDTVVMRGYCEKEGLKISFGQVRTQLLPSRD